MAQPKNKNKFKKILSKITTMTESLLEIHTMMKHIAYGSTIRNTLFFFFPISREQEKSIGYFHTKINK